MHDIIFIERSAELGNFFIKSVHVFFAVQTISNVVVVVVLINSFVNLALAK